MLTQGFLMTLVTSIALCLWQIFSAQTYSRGLLTQWEKLAQKSATVTALVRFAGLVSLAATMGPAMQISAFATVARQRWDLTVLLMVKVCA